MTNIDIRAKVTAFCIILFFSFPFFHLFLQTHLLSNDYDKLYSLSGNNFPPNVSVHESERDSISLNVKCSGFDFYLINGEGMTFTRITIDRCLKMNNVGHPELPYIQKLIAVPQAESHSIEYSIRDSISYDNVTVFPCPKTVHERDSELTVREEFTIDDDIYMSNRFIPEKVVEIADIYNIRNQRVIELRIYPLQFNPAINKVVFYRDFDIVIRNQNSISPVCVKNGPFANICTNVLLNYSTPLSSADSRAMLSTTSGRVDSCTSLDNCTDIDYLMIVGDSLMRDSTACSHIMSLARKRATWNNFNVCVINIEDIITIDGNEEVADSLLKCELVSFYESNDQAGHMEDGKLGYILLMGDAYACYTDECLPDNRSTIIPVHLVGDNEYRGPSDFYYASLDSVNDDSPDVFIGRISVDDPLELESCLEKILDYEPLDKSEEWYKNVMYIGTRENVNIMNTISNYFTSSTPSGFTYKELLYGERATICRSCGSEISDSINAGIGLLCQSGHGIHYYWGRYYYPTNYETLSNTDKYPVIFSLSCETSHFDIPLYPGCHPIDSDTNYSCHSEAAPTYIDDYDCMAERLMNIPDKGAIAYIGFAATTQNWEVDYRVNDFHYNYFSGYSSLGEAVNAYYYLYTNYNGTLTLLGDPALNPFYSEYTSTPTDSVDLAIMSNKYYFDNAIAARLDSISVFIKNTGVRDISNYSIYTIIDSVAVDSISVENLMAYHCDTILLNLNYCIAGKHLIEIEASTNAEELFYGNNIVDTTITLIDIAGNYPFKLKHTFAKGINIPLIYDVDRDGEMDVLIHDGKNAIKALDASGDSVWNYNCSDHIQNGISIPNCNISSYTKNEFVIVEESSLGGTTSRAIRLFDAISMSSISSTNFTGYEAGITNDYTEAKLSTYDVDNDGHSEVIYLEEYYVANHWESMLQLFDYDDEAFTLLDSVHVDYRAIAVAIDDLDQDNVVEICVLGYRELYSSGISNIVLDIFTLDSEQSIIKERSSISIDIPLLGYTPNSFRGVSGTVIITDTNDDGYNDLISYFDETLVILPGDSLSTDNYLSHNFGNNGNSRSTALFADYNSDGDKEVILISDNKIKLVDISAGVSVTDSLVLSDGYLFRGGPYILDVDNDGYWEIVVGAQVKTSTGGLPYQDVVFQLFVLDHSLEEETLFKERLFNVYCNHLCIGDLNNDSQLDVLLQTNEEIYGFSLPWVSGGEILWGHVNGTVNNTNSQKRYISGEYDSDVGFNGTVSVIGDISTDSTSTIYINPGTEMIIADTDSDNHGSDPSKIEIIIDGCIKTYGTSYDPIEFYSGATSPESGDWQGLICSNLEEENVFNYTSICHAEIAIESSSPVELSHCTIDESNSQAFDFSSNASIDSSTIYLMSDNHVDSGDTLSITGNSTFYLGTEDLKDGWNHPDTVEFWVMGRLDIYGNTNDKIEFKSISTSPGGGDWYGIRLSSTTTSTASIRNCKISDAMYGVRTERTITMRNVDVSNCYPAGVYMNEGHDTGDPINESTIDNCNISYNDSTDAVGMRIWYCTDVVVDSCDVNHNYQGIWISDCDATVSYTDASYNDDIGIFVTDYHIVSGNPYVEIEHCQMKENGEEGLYISDSDGYLSFNRIDDNDSHGLYSTGSVSNPVVRKCKIIDHSTGVRINSGVPNLGDVDLRDREIGGRNTIDNSVNNVYQVAGAGGPEIKAKNNYWGTYPPNTSMLKGNITWYPALSSDPVPYLARSSSEGTITSVRLFQNFPNPLKGGNTTDIKFSLPKAEKVSIKVYDVAGRRIKTLVDGLIQPGHHYVTWDGRNEKGRLVATGIYFYQMIYGKDVLSKKIVLLR